VTDFSATTSRSSV